MNRLREVLESAVFQVVKTFFFFLPRKACLRFGRFSGNLFYILDGKHRRIALANLDTAFGKELPGPDLSRIARESFLHFGLVLADIFKLRHMSPDRITELIRTEGLENLKKALEIGKGVLIFTAHFGNWEIASSVVSRLGKLNVVARPLDNRTLENEITGFRRNLGAGVISKHQAAKSILQALRRNEIVAILIDQNVLRSQAVFVDFFGKAAATTPALAAFALRTGSPIVPVFCTPAPGQSYLLDILPSLSIPLEGDHEKDVLKITQTCTKMIENKIRENPSCWLWFHQRWKSRPREEEETSSRLEKPEKERRG